MVMGNQNMYLQLSFKIALCLQRGPVDDYCQLPSAMQLTLCILSFQAK